MKVSVNSYLSQVGYIISILLLGYLINPYNQGFIFGYPIIALILIKKQFLLQNLDIDFTLLSLLSFIYALFFAFDPISGEQYIIIYAVFPPIFYLLGKHLVKPTTASDFIFYLLFCLFFIFSITPLISVLMNFMEGGFDQLDRTLPIFWNGKLVPATVMASYFTFNMCIPALLIADQGKSKLIFRIIAIVIFVLSLVCVIRLGSRTQLGIMLLTSLVSLFYVAMRQSFKKNVFLFMILIGVATYVSTNVSFDLSADWLSTFAYRLEKGTGDLTGGGGRFDRWVSSIQYIIEKPLGWSRNEFGYAHNLWFDVLRVSGIIPFVLLIIFSIRSFINIKNTVNIPSISLKFKTMVFIYSFALFLVFMVEPIFDGMFSLFVLFCIFMGIINKFRTIRPVNP